MIKDILKRHTILNSLDIIKIKEVARSINTTADLMGADIFIDCKTHASDAAIVVAQARPSNSKSRYEGSVVGELAYRKNEPAVLRTLEVGIPTTDMLAQTQENKNVKQNVSPIKNDDGKVIGVLIAEKDVTDHLETEKNLTVLAETTEHLMETLMTPKQKNNSLPYHVTDGIVMFNSVGVCISSNPVAKELYKKLGYMDKLEGIKFSNLALDEISFQDILEKKKLNNYDIEAGKLTLRIKYAVLKNKNLKLTGVAMLISDVTDVRNKEKELILKSVAMSEIHHRVKNNLQTIASLLRLQSRRIENDSVKTAFSESISRVLSIAATHEILAEDGVDDVDIKTMLQRINDSIIDNGFSANKKVDISIKGDTFMVDSDKASSIALVVNEIMQNCMKHAFADRDEGTIKIVIQKGDVFSNISITDDGAGFKVESPRKGSLGTKIIVSIVEDKLHGNLTTDSGCEGTIVFFDFPHRKDNYYERYKNI